MKLMSWKSTSCAASLLALALFAGPLHAQEQQPADQPATEQPAAEQPAVDQPAAEQPAAEAPAAEQPAKLPDDILALLNDNRSSQELSDGELKQRIGAVRSALKTPDLPGDAKSQLQAMADADRAEMKAREQANAKPKEEPAQEQAAPTDQPATDQPATDQPAQAEQPVQKKGRKAKVQEQPAQTDQPAADQPATDQQQAAPADVAPAALPPEVQALLDDTRPLDSLSADELAQRARAARQFSRDEKLPADVREKLAGIAKEARAAAMAKQGGEQPAQQPAAEQPAQQPAAEQPAQQAQPQQPQAPVITEPTPEQTAAPEQQPPAQPQVDATQAKKLDGNAGNPEAEAKAKQFLADTTPADSLKDDELRTRLDSIRDLLAENELSAETERALRDKLRAEREVLRLRVAKVKAEEEAKAQAELLKKQQEQQAANQQPQDQQQQQQGGKKSNRPKIDFNIIITPDAPREVILRDRRPAEELAPEELSRRIRFYREFEAEPDWMSYDDQQRQYWQEQQRRDREILRRRLMEERAARRAMLDQEDDIQVYDQYDNGYDEYPSDIFAAEVDDSEIEKALVAPPRKKITRRVRVEDIAARPELRQAMTRIEVDTIHFGFNEAFVRDEEVDNLDQIASVIEKVLKKYPREIFLIEGHTDAVGSDAYNAKLSKARAEAVKKALTSYYVIPARNLQTVGLGERYLKIPTAEAEAENRRVSISRATPLLGELQE